MLRMHMERVIARLRDTVADERGYVPGWVLITLMTAGLVVVIWAMAGPALAGLFEQAISRVSGFCYMRAVRSRVAGVLGDDGGSSPVEFVLVGMMLTLLTLGVLQLGLSVYVRNVVHDAAVEGAFHAALADASLEDGARRTR